MKAASDPAESAREWADAVPLGNFIANRAASGVNYADLPELDLDESTSSTLRTVVIASRSLLANSIEWSARKRATHDTLNDLIAGRVVGLGRKSNSYEIERIASTFWIGADIDVGSDTVSRRDDETIVDVRVITHRNDGVVEGPVDKPKLGRPTRKGVILGAIEHFAEDPGWWGQSPAQRYKGYKRYISERGVDPDKEEGFSDSTFKKYESKFKK